MAPLRPFRWLPAAALLAGCTVGPNYSGPPTVLPASAGQSGFVRAGDAALAPTPGVARWWETLNDPTLTALVEDALAHSPTVDAAQARIRQAQARVRAQQAAELPSVSASAAYLHARLPGSGIGNSSDNGSGGGSSTLTFYNLGSTASWEPDLFGGGRRAIEQARATVAQRFADLADAQVSLSAQVAQAYVGLRGVQERQRLTTRSADLQQRALELTRQRFTAGTASALDVERLTTDLNNTNAQKLPLAAQIDEYLNQLALLTGRTPGTLDATLGTIVPVPLPPAQVAIGDPAALVAHRPDVRSAERALAASTAEIGVNKAKLLPSLKFNGILGLGGSSLSDVVNPSSFAAILAPMLSWSILDFGRNQAAVRISEAQRDEAEATYRQSVLAALEDAETSLSRFGSVRRQLLQLAQAEASATRSAGLNGERVKAGTSSVIDQLDIERQQLAAALAVADAKTQFTTSYIGVQKALGLGWSDPAPAPAR